MSNELHREAKKLFELMQSTAKKIKAKDARAPVLGKPLPLVPKAKMDAARDAAKKAPKEGHKVKGFKQKADSTPRGLKAAQGDKMVSKKAVKKAEPQKATTNPIKKKAPVAAQPKVAAKKVPEVSKKASMGKGVAKPTPARKLEKTGEAQAKNLKAPSAKAKSGPLPMAPRAKEIAAEMAGEGAFDKLKKDLPKAGAKIAVHEETEAAKAAGKSAFGALRTKALTEGVEKWGKRALLATIPGAAVGLGLQALMESLDAEDGGDYDAHESQSLVNKAIARQRENKAAVQMSHSFDDLKPAEAPDNESEEVPDYGKVAPRSQLQQKLPSKVKAAQAARTDVEVNPDGYEEEQEPQINMENAYAQQLAKWKR